MCLAVPTNSSKTQQYARPPPFSQTDLMYGASGVAAHFDGQPCAYARNTTGASGSTLYDFSSFQPSNNAPQAQDTMASFNLSLAPMMDVSPIISSYPIAVAAASASASSSPKATVRNATANTITTTRRRRVSQHPGLTATQKERLFVQHNYHDLSAEPDIPTQIAKPSEINPVLPAESFPMKCHRILADAEDAGLSHIISWQPHGRAFKIHNPKLFTSQIMSRYFPKMKKLASLQRQFNLYGYERLTRVGPDAGAYYHEAFLRHRPGLSAQRMVRRRVKGTGYKAASNPQAEPDLYSFQLMDVVMRGKRNVSNTVTSNQQVFTMEESRKTPFYPSNGFASRNQDSDAGFVTQSSRSSCNSNSDDSASPREWKNTQQQSSWLPNQGSQQSAPALTEQSTSTLMAAAGIPMPPAALLSQQDAWYQSNTLETEKNLVQDSSLADSTMDHLFMQDFISKNKADFLSKNNLTPSLPMQHNLNLVSKPMLTGVGSQQQQPSEQQQMVISHNLVTKPMVTNSIAASAGGKSKQLNQLEQHPILLEFADLWENATFYPTY